MSYRVQCQSVLTLLIVQIRNNMIIALGNQKYVHLVGIKHMHRLLTTDLYEYRWIQTNLTRNEQQIPINQ